MSITLSIDLLFLVFFHDFDNLQHSRLGPSKVNKESSWQKKNWFLISEKTKQTLFLLWTYQKNVTCSYLWSTSILEKILSTTSSLCWVLLVLFLWWDLRITCMCPTEIILNLSACQLFSYTFHWKKITASLSHFPQSQHPDYYILNNLGSPYSKNPWLG